LALLCHPFCLAPEDVFVLKDWKKAAYRKEVVIISLGYLILLGKKKGCCCFQYRPSPYTYVTYEPEHRNGGKSTLNVNPGAIQL
jgi:hypothetical protein